MLPAAFRVFDFDFEGVSSGEAIQGFDAGHITTQCPSWPQQKHMIRVWSDSLAGTAIGYFLPSICFSWLFDCSLKLLQSLYTARSSSVVVTILSQARNM